ncbi:hypothetical protein Y1Q_0024035 [Alligator mississippiensis]|uniref:Uncharacterized protein n=1 Tax=Alligator mississippiensis TaxID=8496 RepID=A0A151NHL7_ALLMI|nr:hypothetical protein Y1Q_0024035 [Alligator mississippiensis]
MVSNFDHYLPEPDFNSSRVEVISLQGETACGRGVGENRVWSAARLRHEEPREPIRKRETKLPGFKSSASLFAIICGGGGVTGRSRVAPTRGGVIPF